MALENAKLDNGLDVYVDRIPGSNVNNVSMFIPYGSVDEKPSEEGVAHVFEHGVHLQTDNFADRRELSSFAMRSGMKTNANTLYTRTLYYANGLDIEPNMEYLSQILQHTHFPEEAVEHELKAVRREMTTKVDDLNRLHLFSSVNGMFGLPYGRAVGGHHDRINFSAEQLQDLHQQYYKLGNMTLIVTGAAKLDDVAELAHRYFTPDTEPVTEMNRDLPAALSEVTTTGLVREDSRSVRMSVSHPMSPEFRAKFVQNDLAFNVACQAMSIACFRALRYDKGISYNGSLTPLTHNHPNAWHLRGVVTTDGENIAEAKQTFAEIFEQDNSHYTNEDLTGALAMARYATAQSLTSPEDRSDLIVDRLQVYEKPTDLRATIRKLKKLTVTDIRGAIDDITQYAATSPRYTHLTGARTAIGDVDRIIDQSEIV